MIAALILAGGSATRMGGGDKTLLSLGPRTILAEILRRLRDQASLIALSANGDPFRFAAYNLPVLTDAEPDQGPLAGILQGLIWAEAAGAEALLTIPGDTPFISRTLAGRLSPAPACASSAGQIHPLVALWPITVRAQLAGWQDRRVRNFAAAIGMREIPFASADAFLNVNTPADLARAVEMARSMD